jgi:hypothetical protein
MISWQSTTVDRLDAAAAAADDDDPSLKTMGLSIVEHEFVD